MLISCFFGGNNDRDKLKFHHMTGRRIFITMCFRNNKKEEEQKENNSSLSGNAKSIIIFLSRLASIRFCYIFKNDGFLSAKRGVICCLRFFVVVVDDVDDGIYLRYGCMGVCTLFS